MEAAKTQKNLKEMSYPTKKTFKKKRDWYYTSKDKLPNRIRLSDEVLNVS